MPKRYKIETNYEVNFEIEVVEERKDELVLKDLGDGRIYRVRLISESDSKALLDINGLTHVVQALPHYGILVDLTPLMVKKVRPSAAKEEKKVTKPVGEEGVIAAPISGKIVEVKTSPGAEVREGDVIALMESMKMIVEVKSPFSGIVEEIYVSKGAGVNKGDKIMKLKPRKE